ncbi:hypothetical protein MTR_1g014660 [Medicago truncatula]|uniref:Uncharacterized protein n=1 Tax=Medicago truncatula TaxID=3880 RepID=A0A072VEQ2_MEDTR|nr:hypothetical protein MTR_1g014660 [Medicago truncatula]
MNRILRVTMSHPYIGEGGANGFRKMWHLIRGSLEGTCMVQERRSCSDLKNKAITVTWELAYLTEFNKQTQQNRIWLSCSNA